MSKLSEILGVQEEQVFKYNDGVVLYKVQDCQLFFDDIGDGSWLISKSGIIFDMISKPELIKPIPIPMLTEQQITAIKGRIAEGTPWASREAERDEVAFWADEPEEIMGQFSGWADGTSETKVFDFVTPENSPVFLPDLIKGAE